MPDNVRKYTLAEFAAINEDFADNLRWVPDYRQGFIDCARFLGAFKDESENDKKRGVNNGNKFNN